MELMSSLLLCALVALVPQTSGKSKINPAAEIKFNNSLLIQQKSTLRKKLLLNVNGPPLVSNISHMQEVFNDRLCKKCQSCMDRAIKAYKTYKHVVDNRPSAEEMHEDVLTNEIQHRTKRDVPPTHQTVPETPTVTVSETKTAKKVKTRRTKMNKSVTVTKYNMDGEVYALRVKETSMASEGNNDSRPQSTCQVYNVKKSYPCDSSESDSLLASARRKANKKKAKKQDLDKPNSNPTPTTEKVLLRTSIYKKREVDNSQTPENFMPSIEELY